jgi:hypothetical protein
MRRLVHAVVLGAMAAGLAAPERPASAQSATDEVQAIKQEIQKLQERLQRLEQAQPPAPLPASPVQGQPASPAIGAAAAPMVSAPAAEPPLQAGEQEVRLERESLLQVLGLPKRDLLGTRFSGFLVGSFSYNSAIQLVPEFAGGAPALSDPGQTNFRFDRFGLSASRVFAPWLSAAAAVEVESHRDRHSHGFDPAFGCPGAGLCIERFGTEEAETEVTLDRFHVTVIAPVGNGLGLSIGRYDVPFGFERHDEPLNLTATTSEVFQFGRPQRMTGFQTTYAFAPWLDVAAWVVNRWESETTHDPFDDNNRDKSWGGRIGFTPIARGALLNFGIGGFWGPEQDDDNARNRWVIDADVTWQPRADLLFALEAIYGGEDHVEMRQRGIPIAAPAGVVDANWWGMYLIGYYRIVDWLGLAFRYGIFDDMDGARTGVEQVLQSWTITPIVHLSRLIPDLRPTGAVYARSRLPIDWMNMKLEYRLNHSSRSVFSDAKPGEPILDAGKTSHQLQLQLVVNF